MKKNLNKIISLYEPIISNNSINYIKNIFKKKLFYNRDYTNKFKIAFSNFQNINSKKLVFGASCSDLIFNIIFTLSQNKNKKKIIICPSNSFAAIPSAILKYGFDLYIADIDYKTGNICYNSLKKIIKKKKLDVEAVFITHYGGNLVDINKVRKIVGKSIYILEDCAGALGSFYSKGYSCGSKADFACWSFDSMKLVVCGEGGLAYVRNEKILKIFTENLFLGFKNKDRFAFFKKKTKWWEYQLNSYGTRSVFTEVDAAIGYPQLKNINYLLSQKRVIRENYLSNLVQNKNIKILENVNCFKHSNYFFTILIKKKRNYLAKILKKNNIYSSVRYYPINRINLFRSNSINNNFNLPGTKKFFDEALNLPNHNNIKMNDINKICKIINKSLKN